MSNAHAVKAASFVPGLNRELVWKGGGATLIMVPAGARAAKIQSPDGNVLRYVQFTQNVKGGVINLFVHHERPGQFCGKKIVANVEVWQKRLVDGREYLYVDLRPVTITPTHRLVVMSVEAEKVLIQENFVTFETPSPLVGTIVIAPIDSKVMIKAPPVVVESKKPCAAKVTNINHPTTSAVPATPSMMELLAVKWNGRK